MSDVAQDVVAVSENSEVNQGNEAPANPSEQDSQVPTSIPYERFSEVNNEKNELKKKYEEQLSINNRMSGQVTEYLDSVNSTSKEAEAPQIETIDDVMNYIKNEVDSRVKPIEQERKTESYVNNVKNFFANDKEASELRTEIDQYVGNLPSYRKESILTSVSNGDISVLNEIKHTVAQNSNANIKKMVSDSANADINKTLTPGTSKVTRETKSSTGDLISKGKKDGNFQDFFSSFVQSSGLG